MSRRRAGGVAEAMEVGRRGDLYLCCLGARLPAASLCVRVSDVGTRGERSCVLWEPGAFVGDAAHHVVSAPLRRWPLVVVGRGGGAKRGV